MNLCGAFIRDLFNVFEKCFHVQCLTQRLFPSLGTASNRVAVLGGLLINMININMPVSKYSFKRYFS